MFNSNFGYLKKVNNLVLPENEACMNRFSFQVLGSESPNAKLRAVPASNNRDHTSRSLLLLLIRAAYTRVLFFVHIPFVVNRAFSATPTESSQNSHGDSQSGKLQYAFLPVHNSSVVCHSFLEDYSNKIWILKITGKRLLCCFTWKNISPGGT